MPFSAQLHLLQKKFFQASAFECLVKIMFGISAIQLRNPSRRLYYYSAPRSRLIIGTSVQGFHKRKNPRKPSSWTATYALHKAEKIVMQAVYAFFDPMPRIIENDGYVQGCKTTIRQYLDKKDAQSTGNMWKHIKSCWGDVVLQAADDAKDASEVHTKIVPGILQDGSIMSHTGAELAAVFAKMLEEFGISDKILSAEAARETDDDVASDTSDTSDTEFADLSNEVEHEDTSANIDEELPDNEDGWVDEVALLDQDERIELQRDIQLVKLVLWKKYSPSICAAVHLAKQTLNWYYQLTDKSEVYRIAKEHTVWWEDAWIETAATLICDKFEWSYLEVGIQENGDDIEVSNTMAHENLFDNMPALAPPKSTDLEDELERYLNTDIEDTNQFIGGVLAYVIHVSHLGDDLALNAEVYASYNLDFIAHPENLLYVFKASFNFMANAI
ncbi:hypothetical protein EV702DRAFT_1048998 [Suillus placidus]|uniref:Uncharacterized protein n=1 Tax=Suillus placidus TaxID=48579 RepID=A0A9P7CYV3_9AGAM|nr:hypothetical protein EV702DRAFT_1048998 [Suillus placidus]